MNDDMSMEDRPLALGDLAQTESPEIVRAALGRFRRRLLSRLGIVVLAAAIAVFLYPRYFNKQLDLATQIRSGRGVHLATVVHDGTIDGTVNHVVRLSRGYIYDDNGRVVPVGRFGIEIFVTDRNDTTSAPPKEQLVSLLQPNPNKGILDLHIASDGNLLNGLDMSLSFVAGTRIVDIPVAVVIVNDRNASLGKPEVRTLHLDMQKLGIPDWIWR